MAMHSMKAAAFLVALVFIPQLTPRAQAADQPSDARKLAERAVALYTGAGSPRVDEWEADDLFEEAASLGDPKAQMWVSLRAHDQWVVYIGQLPEFDSKRTREETYARKAFPEIRRLASAGDAEAQFLLAEAQRKGGAGAQWSLTGPLALYEQACPRFPLACNRLALLLAEGKAAHPDHHREMDLLRTSCNAGVAIACENLANGLLTGRSRAPNEKGAVDVLAANCERDYGLSCSDLGIRLSSGFGTAENRAKAVDFFARGCLAGHEASCVQMRAEQGDPFAQRDLASKRLHGIYRYDAKELYFWSRLALIGGASVDHLTLKTPTEAEATEIAKHARDWKPVRPAWNPELRAWENAVKRNTRAAYRKYQLAFPDGAHADAASGRKQALDRLRTCPKDSLLARNFGRDSQIFTLQSADLTNGTGEPAQADAEAEVRTTFRLLDGTQFSPLYYDGTHSLRVGRDHGLKGLADGIVGMRVGGKRKLTVPSALAWGEFGEGCNVPPNTAVIIEVELLNLKRRNTTDSWFPLEPGHRWNYALTTQPPVADELEGSVELETRASEKVMGRSVVPVAGARGVTYIGSDSEGFYIAAVEATGMVTKTIYEIPRYLLKGPFKTGTTWSSVVDSAITTPTTSVPMAMRIEADNDTVTVPAGTFHRCLRVSGKGTAAASSVVRVEVTAWYAPGEGLVKETRKESVEGVNGKTLTTIRVLEPLRGRR